MTLKLGPENWGDTRPSEPGVYAVQTDHWLWFKRQTGFSFLDRRGAWSNVQPDYHACRRQYIGLPELLPHQIHRRGMRWWRAVEDDGQGGVDLVEALKAQRQAERSAGA